MSAGTEHPLSRALYEAESSNSVRVTDGDTWGRFDRYGGWIEGELRQCDPQMCIWLTGVKSMEEREAGTKERTE